MKMKFQTLLLILALCLSMAVCGAGCAEAAQPTDEQLQALTEAYNQVAVLYNDIATDVNENGWLNDEDIAADIQTIGATLGAIGTALTGDMSALEGADFDALPDALLEYVPILETLAEQVALLYVEGITVVTDEALLPIANAINEVIPVYNDIYVVAEANGWLLDAQTAEELQAVKGTLTYAMSALTDDPAKLESVSDYDALAEAISQFVPALEELAERVSVLYEG